MKTSPKSHLYDPMAVSAVEATKSELVLAAERLFAEEGISAVSLRAIARAAGQRNISSVQYHFGDRMGLLCAILQFRESQLESVRRELLEDYRNHVSTSKLRALLRVLFAPYGLMSMQQNGIDYIKVMSAYLREIRPKGLMLHPADNPGPSCPVLFEARELLRAELSFLDNRLFHHRSAVVGEMFYAALIQMFSRDPFSEEIYNSLMEDTINMMSNAISTPSII